MVNFIVSLLLGLVPDVLYLTMFIIFAKNIKEKKLKLFLLLAIGYILLIMIVQYQFVFYIVYMVYVYLILKWLYKSQIIDFFIISICLGYMTIMELLLYLLIGKYYAIYYIVARLCLFGIFIFRKKIRKLYEIYINHWNRSDGKKIKSITLRNISIFILNILIVIFNICAIICITASIK